MDTEWGGPMHSDTHGPDFKWVLAAQAGYIGAFEELVARYERRIYRLALTITRDRTDAETVLQNTFVKAYERLGEFRGDSWFSTWVLGIAANEALQRLREKHGDGFVFDQFASAEEDNLAPHKPVDWGDGPGKRYTRSELKQIVSEGLGVLDPLCRTIFFLLDVEKCSSEQVADFLGLPVAAVRSRLSRARLKMHKHLNRYFKQKYQAVPSYTTSAEGKQKELDNGKTISSARA